MVAPAMTSRQVVFVSHANPEDNEFARWLTLKLASLGYLAWSDVTRLFGGEDFWRDIERVIRDEAVKFLYVLSRNSNEKEGSLRELKVADATRKKLGLSDFVIPLSNGFNRIVALRPFEYWTHWKIPTNTELWP
jgi:hypothetical protein